MSHNCRGCISPLFQTAGASIRVLLLFVTFPDGWLISCNTCCAGIARVLAFYCYS